jgi:hypothetical protein
MLEAPIQHSDSGLQHDSKYLDSPNQEPEPESTLNVIPPSAARQYCSISRPILHTVVMPTGTDISYQGQLEQEVTQQHRTEFILFIFVSS